MSTGSDATSTGSAAHDGAAGPLAIAAVQCDIVWEDRSANLERLAVKVEAASDSGARLVLLPEMFATGFSMATDVVAEGPSARTATFLRGQAAARGIWIGGSFACRLADTDRPVNRFLLAGPGGEEISYDKVHPFSYGGEDEHYSAGRSVVTAEIDGVRITPFICYDLRFADWFWNAATATDCYVVVASWPAARQPHWRALLAARAIENQAYVVGVNRVGSGGGVAYAGGSVVVEPFGEVAAEAGSAEELLFASIDPGRVADVRGRYPFLADR
ncbi:MAG: Nitrilase/cyanide hydratase and apolipoprotein N-acyltransferase [Acidimicrobiaceae bacterium]|jgi:predicted amidohydrolase|nr:Nitrilase/cyanide hydratase and apolipoprotein N-acyltransferase [Acidimicrobiaceae bacterium]